MYLGYRVPHVSSLDWCACARLHRVVRIIALTIGGSGVCVKPRIFKMPRLTWAGLSPQAGALLEFALAMSY